MHLRSPGKRALIIGCGVAGPVLAMFLRRAGMDPVVFEGRAEPDDDAGYFLNLAPNGISVLDALGMGHEVISRGTPTTSIVLRNHRAKVLGTVPEKSVLLKRGVLNGALREAALRGGVPVEFGRRLSDVGITSEGVLARFEDGTEAEGDLLVGCDGTHSRTRRQVMPDAPGPRYAGIIDSGGFTKTAGIPSTAGVFNMTFGTQGFFGYQVLDSGEVYWFENHHGAAEPRRGELEALQDEEWRQRLLGLHGQDHRPIQDIISSTGGRIGRWPNYEMPSLSTWHGGTACLAGDAAHAMQPGAGQGASLALEDAMVLAKCLRDIPGVDGAFAAYERLRKRRVEKIAREARRTGARKAPTNAVSRGIRDLIMPVFLKVAARNAAKGNSYKIYWNEKA